MGNYRFRLSDMMPNAWFYKLKDMSKSRNQNPSHPINKKLPLPTQGPRNSLYHTTESISVDRLHNSPANPKAFDTHFPHDPPRKSSKKRTKRKTIYKPSPRRITPSAASAGRICREPGNPAWIKPETVLVKDCFESTVSCHTSPDQQDFLESISSEFEYSDSFDAPHQWMDEGPASCPSSCSCSLSSSASDIIIDMNETRYNTKKIDKVEFDMVSEPELPPILTRPRKHNALQESPEFKNSSVKFQTEKHSTQKKKNTKTATSPATRKSFSHSGGVKIQGNRAKLGSKKIDTRGRKSLKGEKKGCFYSESLAIVKASFDPEKDFRDSMMEMIVENNIRASKDLEELLACYLSLNSSQYHHLIIKAFEQIWFNMPQSHL